MLGYAKYAELNTRPRNVLNSNHYYESTKFIINDIFWKILLYCKSFYFCFSLATLALNFARNGPRAGHVGLGSVCSVWGFSTGSLNIVTLHLGSLTCPRACPLSKLRVPRLKPWKTETDSGQRTTDNGRGVEPSTDTLKCSLFYQSYFRSRFWVAQGQVDKMR